MMSDQRRLFLSMVSNEFRSYRELLCQDLERGRVEVATQEKFGTLGTTTLEKLDDYMQECSAVIHLVGDGIGHVPPPAAVDALLARYSDLLERLAEHSGLTREILAGCSYTQWEAYLAIFHKVGLYIYKSDEEAPREAGFIVNDAEKKLQTDHFNRIKALGRDRDTFLNEERLSSKVLGALNGILPPHDSRAIISIPRLPHSPKELIGREHWLTQLDEAWQDTQQHIVVVRAWGGVGKTALATAWMAEMEYKGWRAAERVFYWSFYSQGTRRDGESAASADSFIAKALEFFGDPDPIAGSAWNRGERLARLVGNTKCLLVLDGLEPLQHPPGPMSGRLTDPALSSLLSGLAAQNGGLCIMTTREDVTDLDGRLTVKRLELDQLSREAGAALLHKNGVKRVGDAEIAADDTELFDACSEVEGHALTLTLMGKYLALACGGDIRQRDTFCFAEADPIWVTTADQNSPYGHAFKVIAAYERWFLDESAERSHRDRRECRLQLAILRLLGLFNRPASADCLAALREGEIIEGLTEELPEATARDWTIAVKRLENDSLVKRAPPTGNSFSLDAHPLVREYFGRQLRVLQPNAFKEAHSKLFDHLCEHTENQPDTLDGLQPLYQAIVHGCLAGRQQEALDSVFLNRIQRGTGIDGFFTRRKLGAIGADLGAMVAFFEQPWNRLHPILNQEMQAWIFSMSAFSLRALGRMSEALEPIRIGLTSEIEREDWQNAAITAGNLSELEVTLGRIEEAVTDSRCAIDFANRSGDAFQQMSNYARAGDALHQNGERVEARVLLEKAEALQRKSNPKFDLLFSLRGGRYCDLILAPAERAAWQEGGSEIRLQNHRQDSYANLALTEAERRADWALGVAMNGSRVLFDIALNHLTLARIALYRALLASPRLNPDYQNTHMLPALNGLRKAGYLDELPKGLLTASVHHHLIGDPDTACHDLDEAQQIAERGPMPLYLADVHLHRARLFRDKVELSKAAGLIHKHKYGRRYEELKDAEDASANW